uniref:Solute carrier family 35 member F3 n=1 Tax=Ovis aries TaxID=9940 RepID=A0AC11EUQ1_SHEEP
MVALGGGPHQRARGAHVHRGADSAHHRLLRLPALGDELQKGGAPPGLPGPGGGPGAGGDRGRWEIEPPLLEMLPRAAQEDLLGCGGGAVRVRLLGGCHAARQADLQKVRCSLHPDVVCHQLELFILPLVLRGAHLQVSGEAVSEAEIQIVAAILAIAGIVMMTYADGFHSHSVIGIALVVGSASMSALYKVLFKLLLGSAKFGEAALFLSILGVFNILFITCIPVILYFTKVEYWSSFDDIPWGNLCGFSVLLLTFNIVLNFGIAVTYPTLMSLGIVLSVPVNAGKLLWLSASVCKHTHASTHVHTRTHIYSCLPGTVFRFNLLYRKKPLG